MYHADIEAEAPAEATVPRPWYRQRRVLWWVLPVAGLILLYLLFRWLSAPVTPPPPPPPMVTVAQPLQRLVDDWDDYTGRFEASQAVEVRPRVAGQLVGIHFRDGTVVHKGDLLFTIDPRPFQAALAEAQAQVSTTRTALGLARANLARASKLISAEAVSAEEIDQLRAQVRSSQASLEQAQAQVRARALDVEFASVRAPVTGRASNRRVDVGNQVNAGGTAATLLTTINAVDPIYFYFDGSEALFLKHQRQNQRVQTVDIRLQDESGYNWHGKVDFTDNAIDDGSGTIRGRAVIANPAYFLVPGMFGSMRLSGGVPHQALLVPDAAVQTDQVRKVVYVVGPGNTVIAKPVDVGALAAGLRVIRSGIVATDKVIIQGASAQPGAKVNVANGRIEPGKPANDAPQVNNPAASQATLVGAH